MRATLKNAGSALLAVLAALALGSSAGAQEAGTSPAKESDAEASVHINAVKDPELHSYRAIVAGLDKFDEKHEMAPAVPQLRFAVRPTRGKTLEGEPVAARIAADDFSIPLVLDGDARFSVPRSQAAYDAKAELLLNRKKRDARVEPWIRSPGLADNQVRLGDVRLDCQVKMAIGKEEAPFWVIPLVNGILLTRDWCSWFKGPTPKGGDRSWSQEARAPLASATLRDGERSVALKVKKKSFNVPIGDTSWSHDAIIELEYAPAEPPASGEAEPVIAAAQASGAGTRQ